MRQQAVYLQTVTGEVRLIHDGGLHARPSVMFTRLAKSFSAIVQIADNDHGPWIDAKSIVKVMGLKVPFGTMLFIRAQGLDAGVAVQKLSQLVTNDFEESQILTGTGAGVENDRRS